ncbi:MAG: HAMP domain-containing sensor histidine kinase [Amaricoccus sp.]
MTPARIGVLSTGSRRRLAVAPHGTAAGDAAAYNAAQVPALAAAQAQVETRRRDQAVAAMDGFAAGCTGWRSAELGSQAPLALGGLLPLGLPAFVPTARRRDAAAEALAAGAPTPGQGGHDELGLLLARVRRVASHVARDRARLNLTVAERTAELRDANARLAQADAERRRFFCGRGHELRTPLTVILGEAELGARQSSDPALRQPCDNPRPGAALFRRPRIHPRAAQRAASSSSTGHRWTSLAVAVGGGGHRHGAAACAGAQRTVRAERCRGSGSTGTREWLPLVLAGLLENAGKYAGRGATVSVAARSCGGRAVVTVADDGPGIPPERLEAAFDRFARGGGGKVPGFGVGLALARWVVEAHGGGLRAEAPGEGLRVVMTLPLAEPEPDSCRGC